MEVSATLVATTILHCLYVLEDPALIRPLEAAKHGQDDRIGNLFAKKGATGADIPFCWQKDQGVARPVVLVEIEHSLHAVIDIVIRFCGQGVVVDGRITDLNRVGPAGNGEDRGMVKMPGKDRGIDGGAGDNQFEIGPFRQQVLEKSKEKIDIQAPLMGLVNDNHPVFAEQRIVSGLRQQHPVGHEFDPGISAGLVVKADLVANQSAISAVFFQLLADPFRHRDGGHPTRLGATDEFFPCRIQLQAELRELGGLSRTGITGNNDGLVGLQGLLYLGLMIQDGQDVRRNELSWKEWLIF